ncbi:hypothetical protein SAMN02745220_02705 [Desulfopila aestuarii DSM 18488]|uniref:Uncharacterized protein n=1 Tax=Desulfopila aestuarii DSM 18488 TaxID=1121416 RepID=A0A1M7Y922_9BACT|nr:hypothetical protein SAMN02745220_02705 [Desulfopila aestuarii DSM 18488]
MTALVDIRLVHFPDLPTDFEGDWSEILSSDNEVLAFTRRKLICVLYGATICVRL